MKDIIKTVFALWVECPHCKNTFGIKEKSLWYICPYCKDIIDIDYKKLIENAHIGVNR